MQNHNHNNIAQLCDETNWPSSSWSWGPWRSPPLPLCQRGWRKPCCGWPLPWINFTLQTTNDGNHRTRNRKPAQGLLLGANYDVDCACCELWRDPLCCRPATGDWLCIMFEFWSPQDMKSNMSATGMMFKHAGLSKSKLAALRRMGQLIESYSESTVIHKSLGFNSIEPFFLFNLFKFKTFIKK